MNEDLIRRVAQRVENEEFWDQFVWTSAISSTVAAKVEAAQVCPSRGCIAGWTLYEGDRLAYERLVHAMHMTWLDYVDSDNRTDDDMLCCDIIVAWLDDRYGHLIVEPEYESESDAYHRVNAYWTVIAGVLLGIDPDVAQYTFNENRRPAEGLTVSEAMQKWAAGTDLDDVWV